MTDSNQKGVAHRHSRPSPTRRRFDESLAVKRLVVRSPEFILPDNNTFGHLDLRSLVDDFDNSGDE